MTYRELYYKATRLLDNGKITLGEYEEMTKPLDREVEQEPVLDKIRAEIAEYGSIMVAYTITKGTKTDKGIEKLVSDVLKQAKKQVLSIIDKYRAESEVDNDRRITR